MPVFKNDDWTIEINIRGNVRPDDFDDPTPAAPVTGSLLLESGDYFLLESGDQLLLE